MMKKEVIIKDFGFKVRVKDAPVRKFEGEEILDVDFHLLAEAVMDKLLLSTDKLTGNQVRFLRKQLRLKQEEVAEYLGRHQSNLSPDENKGDEPAFDGGMAHSLVKLFFLKKRKEQLVEHKKTSQITETPFEFFIHSASDYGDPETTVVVERKDLTVRLQSKCH